MKKNIIALSTIFCLFSYSASAYVIMQDFMDKIMKEGERVYEKYSEIEQKASEFEKKYISKLTKMSEDVGEFTNNVISTTTDFINDPMGVALKVLDKLGEDPHSKEYGDNTEKMQVINSNPTAEEFRALRDAIEELERQKSADVYAATYVRRQELVAEGLDKKSPELNSKQAAYRAMNIRIPKIVENASYIYLFETLSNELYYTNTLTKFRSHDNEEEGE